VLVLSAAVLVIVIDARDVGPWGDGARGFTTKARRARRFLAGEWVLRWPRIATEDHGKGDGVVLVLSAAVLVIVIDARDVGPWGSHAGVVDHERYEFHEKRFGRTRTQRSGTRSSFRCHQRSAAVLGPPATPLHPTI
jgi:hypothetical protein